MPTYEYRCPKGHTFETFHRMSDPGPEGCEVCGSAPLEKVLYPAAIHFKGSGFYTTDYGRGSRKRDGKEGDSKPDSGSDSGSGDVKPEKSEKKPAETGS
jgi:putative FmdB family regulatory protein